MLRITAGSGEPPNIGGEPMSIYMQLTDVEGEVTTKGFEKQIEIMTASFSTARNIASPARKANGRESSEPMLSTTVEFGHLRAISPGSVLDCSETAGGRSECF